MEKLTKEQLLDMFKKMQEARIFDLKVAQLVKKVKCLV